jgi:hypothetical protein
LAEPPAPPDHQSQSDPTTSEITTAAELAAKCHKAALEGRWKTCMRFFAGPKLLIIDELDYLSLPEDAASALFQVINQRYLKHDSDDQRRDRQSAHVPANVRETAPKVNGFKMEIPCC